VAADPGATGRRAARRGVDDPLRSRRTVLRAALAVAAFVQVALAVPVLAGADLHLSREIASFEVAMAVGFALAAWRPQRARGFVPVAAVLATALALTSVVDVVSAQTEATYEAGHLVAMVQAVLLWALARQEAGRRGVGGAAVAAA
jgi:predicted anti-sigma-YlaC factor YlaD